MFGISQLTDRGLMHPFQLVQIFWFKHLAFQKPIVFPATRPSVLN